MKKIHKITETYPCCKINRNTHITKFELTYYLIRKSSHENRHNYQKRSTSWKKSQLFFPSQRRKPHPHRYSFLSIQKSSNFLSKKVVVEEARSIMIYGTCLTTRTIMLLTGKKSTKKELFLTLPVLARLQLLSAIKFLFSVDKISMMENNIMKPFSMISVKKNFSEFPC